MVIFSMLDTADMVLAFVEEGVVISLDDDVEVLGPLTVNTDEPVLVVVLVGLGLSLASAVPFGFVPVSMYPYAPVFEFPHFSRLYCGQVTQSVLAFEGFGA